MQPTPDRLSALDAAFLDIETSRAPMHIGWTMRFDGDPPSLAALRRHLDGRLDALPRFRRRIARSALGLGDPHWVDDAAFDIAGHVHAVRLAEPASPSALPAVAAALLSVGLDHARPLWQMTLVTGLPEGGFALVGQAHHALVDGVAAIELALLLFDGLGAPAAASQWRPARAPSAARALTRGVAGGVTGGAQALAGAGPAVLRDAAAVVGSLAAPAARTGLDRSATRERRVAFASTPLNALRAVTHRRGATVNDALLAAAGFAIGAALRRRGEEHDEIRALVPASVRSPGEGGASHANRIAFLALELPVAEDDPERMLQIVRARTRARKLGGDASAGDALLRMAELLPAPGRKAVARAARGAANFAVIVSGVPGPATRLGLMGRPLAGVWPAVPLPDGHALTIGAVSYEGMLNAGVYADAVVVPDAREIAADLDAAFTALAALPAPGATPWQARARARRDAQRAASR